METPRLDVVEAYRRCWPAAIRCATRVLTDADEAQDAVHQAFLRLLRTSGGFRGDATVMTYVLTSVTRECLNRLKARRVRARPEALASLVACTAEAAGQERGVVARDLLARLCDALEPDELLVADLKYGAGFTHDEVACTLGVSTKTVQRRVDRIERLARAFAEGEGGR